MASCCGDLAGLSEKDKDVLAPSAEREMVKLCIPYFGWQYGLKLGKFAREPASLTSTFLVGLITSIGSLPGYIPMSNVIMVIIN